MNDDQAFATAQSAEEYAAEYKKGFIVSVAAGVICFTLGAFTAYKLTREAYLSAIVENTEDQED